MANTQKNIRLIYIDLFCGGGGTTTGVHKAMRKGERCAIVAACINHDANAIRSHKSNHKQTLHFTEDITLLYSTRRMMRLVNHVNYMRELYPEAEVVLWASLECTNFSKAKGGQPRDADSRTLADHLFPYIEAIDPDRIQIENVEEFMSWGPLDENGKPISRTQGQDYMRWVNKVKSYGYRFEHRILNAADFGAYTSRKRFFGQFARLTDEIFWPEQTHAEHPSTNLFGSELKKWNAVRDVLDFTDEGESIFDRKKPLVDATLERIYAGLIKYVAGGKKAFLAKAYSGKPQHKVQAIDKPAGTITTVDHHQIIHAKFIQQRNSGIPDSKICSIDKPSRTLTSTGGNLEIVTGKFISAYYGNGDNVSSVESPSPTVTTKDRLSLVQTHFIDQQYGQSKPAAINRPAGTITGNPKLAPVTVKRFIMNQYSGGGQSSSLEKPSPAISTVPKQNLITPKSHYLLNPQFTSAGGSVDRPCFTLIARMDKMPPYLIGIRTEKCDFPSFIKLIDGVFVYEIYSDDTKIMVEIKEFMAMYGILDILMRMLRIPELKKIMGFPEDYVLIGTQAEQKKFIGNAVEVHMATAMVEATAIGIINKQKNIAV